MGVINFLGVRFSKVEMVESIFTLRSRHVFIDASVYHSNNFQFMMKDLASLSRLLDSDQLTLLFTTITVAEVKRHLMVQAREAASAAQSFQQKAKVLRNIPIFSQSVVFGPVNAESLGGELVDGFEKFLSARNIEVLSVDIASADKVFENYFKVLPPFSLKKPDEFRDAFVLETLKAYARQREVRIHIISTDKDMADYCQHEPSLMWSGKLGEVVNALMHSSRTEPAAFADLAYSSVKPRVLDIVRTYLADQDFTYIDSGEPRIQGFRTKVENLRGVNERVLEADHTLATYAVDFEFDVIAEYYQAEPPKPEVIASQDFLEVYHVKQRFVKTVEAILYLEFYEGDVESVYLEDWDVTLKDGDNLWDEECQETIRRKEYEF